jgi:hypothetical protein
VKNLTAGFELQNFAFFVNSFAARFYVFTAEKIQVEFVWGVTPCIVSEIQTASIFRVK